MFNPKANTYAGSFNDRDWHQVHKNGLLFDPAPSLKIRNHSPDGFAFGYCGSGPAQLALGILLEEFDAETAQRYYQDFKSQVIASFSQDEAWTLTSEQVYGWLSNYLQARLQAVKDKVLQHTPGSPEWRDGQHTFQELVLELYDLTGTRFL